MSELTIDGVTVTVEVGFSTSGGAGQVPIGSTLSSIVWTDVSAYVRSVNINRGRSSELDQFVTGAASVVLSNSDRRFDPLYTSGPYYGSLTPLRPIRIRAQYGAGSTTDLFFGWVDGWPQSYDFDVDATVTLSASDGFKVLNSLTLTSYWDYITPLVGDQVSGVELRRWFRMDEGTGAARTFETVNATQPGFWVVDDPYEGTQSSGEGVAGLIVGSDNGAMDFNGDRYLWFPKGNLMEPESIAVAERTVEFWFSTTQSTEGRYGIMFAGDIYNTYLATGMVVDASGFGSIEVWCNDIFPFAPPVFTSLGSGAGPLNDGRPHHVTINHDRGVGSCSVTIDGLAMVYARDEEFTTQPSIPSEDIGHAIERGASSGNDFPLNFSGTIDEVCIYNGLLGTTYAAERYNQGRGLALSGQRTDERVDTVLALSDWMSDGTDLGTGAGTSGGLNPIARTVLSLLQDTERAEQGRLFMNASGQVKFISRHDLSTVSTYNTVQRTYGDGAGELPYTSFLSEYDDQLIFNDVTATRQNGVTVRYQNTISQGQYFRRSDDIGELVVDTNRQVVDIALARLNFYDEPRFRVEEITVNPRRSPSELYPAVIADEIGTRFNVKRRPQGVGTAIDEDVLVEGIRHTITQSSWETVYRLSPAPPQYFVLDSSSFGVLDTNILGY